MEDRMETYTKLGAAGNIEADENRQMIASDKVEGTAVYSRDGERLGSVHNFMVDKVSGQVAYAVMSFGGFLGIGDRYHPLPWKSLTYDTGLGGYVVDLSRAQLEGGPTFAPDEDPWADRAFESQVYDYYGTA